MSAEENVAVTVDENGQSKELSKSALKKSLNKSKKKHEN